MTIHRHSWLYMAIHGHIWLCITRYGGGGPVRGPAGIKHKHTHVTRSHGHQGRIWKAIPNRTDKWLINQFRPLNLQSGTHGQPISCIFNRLSEDFRIVCTFSYVGRFFVDFEMPCAILAVIDKSFGWHRGVLWATIIIIIIVGSVLYVGLFRLVLDQFIF